MLRILVVDDDKTMCEEFSDLLKEEGHKVAAAHSGPKALDYLQEHEIDVLFTDLKMPRMNGLELMREVRRLYPAVYPVMITGYATVDTAVEALKLGAFDYVQKPFRMEHVKSILGQVLDDRKFKVPWTDWPTEPGAVLAKLVKEGASGLAFSWGAGEHRGSQVVRFDATGAPSTVAPRDLHRVKELATMHANKGGKPAVLVENVEKLAEGHAWKDVFAALFEVRGACESKGGMLLLTMDPAKLTQEQVGDLRRLSGEPFVNEVVETLASPIRRAVIAQLERGPATFSEIMRTTGVDDSPKLTFHLKKLVTSGILLHEGEKYALGDKGRRAAKFLEEMETEGALKLAGPGLMFEAKG